MNIKARDNQFLAFTNSIMAPMDTRWVKVGGRTNDTVCRNDTHLWCVNCGTKFEITEKRCWQCDQPNCFYDDGMGE